jgi:acetyl-CoA acyltransferase
MKQAYIVDAIRTPIGNFTGSLAPVRADDLAAHVIKALVDRHPELDLAAIDDVIMGCANQAGEDNRNVARMAALLAGLPVTVPGETVNRLCASGMSAVVQAGRAIAANSGDLFIAGGVEHMTRGPWVMSKTSTPYGRDAQLFDSSFGWRFVNPVMKDKYGVDAMGETAENLLDLPMEQAITREDQDQFALWSQQKATSAQQSGRLAKEIAAVAIPQRKGDPLLFAQDEFVKPKTSWKASRACARFPQEWQCNGGKCQRPQRWRRCGVGGQRVRPEDPRPEATCPHRKQCRGGCGTTHHGHRAGECQQTGPEACWTHLGRHRHLGAERGLCSPSA